MANTYIVKHRTNAMEEIFNAIIVNSYGGLTLTPLRSHVSDNDIGADECGHEYTQS